MKKLVIEKYISDKLDEHFTVPIAFIRMLNAILPDSAIDSLNEHNIELS